MPKSSAKTLENSETTAPVERTDPQSFGGNDGNSLLAAWQGVANLFGGQVEGWDYVKAEGDNPAHFVARGFTVEKPYDPKQIVSDITSRDRRVSLVDAYPIVVLGETPAPFTDSLDMTKWMQQYFRKPNEEGKSPQYVKDAISAFKKEHNFPAKKGRPKKIIRIENLGELNADALAGVDTVELEKLQATIAAAMAAKSNTSEQTAEAATA